MSTASKPKPAGLTEGHTAAAKAPEKSAAAKKEAPAKPAPEAEEVSRETSPESKAPAETSAPKATDEQILADLRKRRPDLFAEFAKGAPGTATTLDEDEKIKWEPYRTRQHLFQVARRPNGKILARPESFVGDLRIVKTLAELEYFDIWPNSRRRD